MHKLHRIGAPACLAGYSYRVHQWSLTSPTVAERQTIWACLDAMQFGRCAYCERQVTTQDRHIEHFRQRSKYSQGTFEWPNLFGSCNDPNSCGKYKDGCGPYNHFDIIKPDAKDPDEYFIFVSDGTIALRQGLSPAQCHKAKETLRVFNLDARHGALRHMRRAAAAGYLQTAENFKELAEEFDESEWGPLLQQELANVAHLPFSTVIRHALIGI